MSKQDLLKIWCLCEKMVRKPYSSYLIKIFQHCKEQAHVET